MEFFEWIGEVPEVSWLIRIMALVTQSRSYCAFKVIIYCEKLYFNFFMNVSFE